MKKQRNKANFIIGIDEVGRGALAGPVVVAAVAATRKFRIKKDVNSKFLILNSKLVKLRDSKRLSSRQREIWFKYVKENQNLFYSVASIQPKLIDKINISRAANLAATRALTRLLATRLLVTRDLKIFLDGGLYLNKQNLVASGYRLDSKTVVRGDEKIPAIMLASIIAKVTRDRRMKTLHKRHSQYDFINNVGYGTKRHIKAIRKFGHSPIHRKSFKIKELI